MESPISFDFFKLVLSMNGSLIGSYITLSLIQNMKRTLSRKRIYLFIGFCSINQTIVSLWYTFFLISSAIIILDNKQSYIGVTLWVTIISVIFNIALNIAGFYFAFAPFLRYHIGNYKAKFKKEIYLQYYDTQKVEKKEYLYGVLGSCLIGVGMASFNIINLASLNFNGTFQINIPVAVLSFFTSSLFSFSLFVSFIYGNSELIKAIASLIFALGTYFTTYLLISQSTMILNCDGNDCILYGNSTDSVSLGKIILILSQFGIFLFKEFSNYFILTSEQIFEDFFNFLNRSFLENKSKFLRIMKSHDIENKIYDMEIKEYAEILKKTISVSATQTKKKEGESLDILKKDQINVKTIDFLPKNMNKIEVENLNIMKTQENKN